MQKIRSVSPSASALPSAWRDTAPHRLMLTALLNMLDNALLTTDSATRTLEQWCRTHHLAGGTPAAPAVRAILVDTPQRPCPDSLRVHLALPAQGEKALRYRHVRLMCGSLVLSDAENWYLPERLTAKMNAALETTDTPFGRAIADLAFTRQLVVAERLWSPLPQGWENTPIPAGTGESLDLPPQTLRHQAVLHQPDGLPLSAVIETYTSEAFHFPPPNMPDDQTKN